MNGGQGNKKTKDEMVITLRTTGIPNDISNAWLDDDRREEFINVRIKERFGVENSLLADGWKKISDILFTKDWGKVRIYFKTTRADDDRREEFINVRIRHVDVEKDQVVKVLTEHITNDNFVVEKETENQVWLRKMTEKELEMKRQTSMFDPEFMEELVAL